MTDVLLISMPFGALFRPSIGLSLLKPAVTGRQVSVEVRYFSIAFAEMTGRHFYSGIESGKRPSTRELAGDWIFSGALFDASPEDEARYVDEVLRQRAAWTNGPRPKPVSETLIKRILATRRRVDRFLDGCVEEIIRRDPTLVGFTSMFQQHVASLALARRIKQSLPATFIVFGGANCEGVMGAETVRQFPFVDAAVSGEGDLLFPELVERVLDSRPVVDLPGVRTRERVEAEFAAGRFPNAPRVNDLDQLPYPDYTDFVEQFEASRFRKVRPPGFYFETSRGCWWGEKQHCTFCGLNGSTMTFRSKTPRRAVDELAELADRHPESDVWVVDNIIDMAYFKTFLPELKRRQLGLDLFYETKSNLTKEHLRAFRDAGINRFQPGIESFSNPVLKLMRKGVTGLQNIQLLKWSAELGVTPMWNVLWGFPGEPPEEYARMAKLVPLLTHLPPPGSFAGIHLDRFSPNFFDADALGFTDVAPLAPYRSVYPLSDEAMANLAYFFSFRYAKPQAVEEYVAPLLKALRTWQRVADKSALCVTDLDDHLFILDLRPVSQQPLTVISGIERMLYDTCDHACTSQQLAQVARSQGVHGLSAEEVEQRLAPLVSRGLMVVDSTKYLALAVRRDRSSLPGPVRKYFSAVVRGAARGPTAAAPRRAGHA